MDSEPETKPKITRTEFIEFMGRLRLYISEDNVSAEDEIAMGSCGFLALYALDHMTDEDFIQGSPMWRAL